MTLNIINKTESKAERIEWLDIARGIGIILVVLGHTNLIGIRALIWIFSFHMPFFFVMSGFCYKERNIIAFLKRKGRSLLLPYILYYCLYILLDLILGTMSIQQFPVFCKNILLGLDDTLWFIMALFMTEFIYVLLETVIKKKVVQYMVIVVISCVGFVFAYEGISCILRIHTAFTMLFFFSIGVWLKKTCFFSTEPKKKVQLILGGMVCICLNIVFAFLNTKVDVRTGFYGNVLYFIIGAITGTMMIMIFSFLMRKLSILEFFGRNSLCIYALNSKIPFWVRALDETMSGIVIKIISGICLLLAMILNEKKNSWFKR